MARSSAEPVRSIRAVVAAAALLLAGACAAPVKGPVLLHPTPPTAERYALVQGAVVYEDGQLRVEARPWDWRLVEDEVREAGGPSPFGEAPGETGRFVFVRVSFENRSADTLVYNAMRSSLVQPHESPVLPLETSDLFAFSGEDRDVEARARTFRQLCYDGTVSLPAGGKIEAYLVFPAPKTTKATELVLDEVWIGSRSRVLRFPFEVYPGK